MKKEVAICEKYLLTLEEAALYTGIGINKLREMSNDENCDFVVWNGSRRMLKRKKLEEFLNAVYSI
ncbi:excisionase [Anaerotignum lactatifermentans]|mgnify:FL=1|jgi:excisionase|uniref:Transposon Tn916 excisionase n=1 Tax=Anaerotignum lactatifermentans DSM 14214 TaxID=1121323 RepID=A0A1M6PMK8_9FIRM|nr:excisionase [Anaerotignum lactatifermentans]SHK09153.1 transposon Tn916 excisionase [[Clostridium] lactatifermentans DSM 14214] [Anaerotignum lactatifermentans DSM 14214]